MFDDECPFFHGHLTLDKVVEILSSDEKIVGSYLTRKCGIECVISYKDINSEIKHCIVREGFI